MSDAGPIIVRRKKVQAAAHHGGAWKVAYADFVTAMMAFFMVMWIMGMDAETRSMIQGYFNDPMGFIKNPPKSKSPFHIPGAPDTKPGQSKNPNTDFMDREKSDREELQKIKKQLQEKADEAAAELKEIMKHVELKITDEGLQIEFVEAAGAVFFESGKATILPAARNLIGEVAPILAKSGRKIIVEGHTDAAPYPGEHYTNWELSSDRAEALRGLLSEKGISLEQFNQVRGCADTQLKDPEHPLSFVNRRVTVLLPFKSKLRTQDGLPSDMFKNEIQGAFRSDLSIEPERPDIGGKTKK